MSSAALSHTRKKESPSFLHDADAAHDQKILRLRAKGGWAWYGLYWACIEAMRRSSSYCLELVALDGIALSLAISEEDLRALLNACVSFGLFEQDETHVWSPSLNRRMEHFEEAREQRRNAGKASAQKRSTSVEHASPPCSPPVQREVNERSTGVETSFNAPNTNTNTNQNTNEIEIKTSGSGAREYLESLVQALPDLPDKAASFHDAVASALIVDGWNVQREAAARIDSLGLEGRIDILATRDGETMAIELDNVTPRGKSILKLMAFQGARLAVVRRSRQVFEVAPEEPEDADPLAEYLPIAEKALLPADTPAVQRDNRFMGAGRRPLKRYSEIWLTPHEYAQALKIYIEAGVPPEKISIGAQEVESQIRTHKQQGRSVEGYSCFNALIGWALVKTLDRCKKSNDLKRSEKYLKEARP